MQLYLHCHVALVAHPHALEVETVALERATELVRAGLLPPHGVHEQCHEVVARRPVRLARTEAAEHAVEHAAEVHLLHAGRHAVRAQAVEVVVVAIQQVLDQLAWRVSHRLLQLGLGLVLQGLDGGLGHVDLIAGEVVREVLQLVGQCCQQHLDVHGLLEHDLLAWRYVEAPVLLANPHAGVVVGVRNEAHARAASAPHLKLLIHLDIAVANEVLELLHHAVLVAGGLHVAFFNDYEQSLFSPAVVVGLEAGDLYGLDVLATEQRGKYITNKDAFTRALGTLEYPSRTCSIVGLPDVGNPVDKVFIGVVVIVVYVPQHLLDHGRHGCRALSLTPVACRPVAVVADNTVCIHRAFVEVCDHPTIGDGVGLLAQHDVEGIHHVGARPTWVQLQGVLYRVVVARVILPCRPVLEVDNTGLFWGLHVVVYVVAYFTDYLLPRGTHLCIYVLGVLLGVAVVLRGYVLEGIDRLTFEVVQQAWVEGLVEITPGVTTVEVEIGEVVPALDPGDLGFVGVDADFLREAGSCFLELLVEALSSP